MEVGKFKWAAAPGEQQTQSAEAHLSRDGQSQQANAIVRNLSSGNGVIATSPEPANR